MVTKPVVNGSAGTWGSILNTALDDLQTQVDAAIRHPIYTAAGKPSPVAGAHILESDTGYEQVAKTVGGNATWTPEVGSPVLRLVQTTSQNIPDTTPTAITWSSATLDRLGGGSSGTANRYTCQLAGIYDWSGTITFNTGATGVRSVAIYVGGSAIVAGTIQSAAQPSNSFTLVVRPTWITMAAGEYLQIFVTQTNGGQLGTGTGSLASHLQARYLGPA